MEENGSEKLDAIFSGQFTRSIVKNRMQLPSQFRNEIDPDKEGCTLRVTLGETPGTLAIYTEDGFKSLARRISSKKNKGPRALRFRLQFFALTAPVDLDKQGRLVLPEKLRDKAGLKDDVVLVGQLNRIEIWNQSELDAALGVDWEGDEWVEWHEHLDGDQDD